MPSLEKFTLEKIHVAEGGEYSIHWNYEDVDGAEINKEKEQKKSSKAPHPDLTGVFLKLVPIVAKLWGSGWLRALMEKEGFNPTEDQLAMTEELYKEIMTGIRVTGIELTGVDETAGVNIKAEIKLPNGDKTTWKAPRIYFVGKSLGVEQDLEDHAKNLERECWQYLYKNKKAQLDSFADDDKTDPA